MPQDVHSYTAPAKALHWLMAIVIIVASIIGIYGASLDYGIDASHDAYKGMIITLHKNIATTVLFLIVARILWRITHRPPELMGMSPIMAKLAHLGHLVLYVLMVVVPVSGWLNSSSAGYEIPVAYLFEIPRLMEKNKALTPYLSGFHEYIAWALLVIVAGHVAFALKHKFIDRDGSFEAMAPGRK